MGPQAVEDASLLICRKAFREVDWENIKTVCCYDPIAELKEVDVRPLLEAINYKYPQIKIKVLKQNKKQVAPKSKFNVIIVPCLAFDSNNYRLGWGGGFYDKFLAAQPNAQKIGVCFQSGFIKKLPREPHDIPLDKVVTEM